MCLIIYDLLAVKSPVKEILYIFSLYVVSPSDQGTCMYMYLDKVMGISAARLHDSCSVFTGWVYTVGEIAHSE